MRLYPAVNGGWRASACDISRFAVVAMAMCAANTATTHGTGSSEGISQLNPKRTPGTQEVPL